MITWGIFKRIGSIATICLAMVAIRTRGAEVQESALGKQRDAAHSQVGAIVCTDLEGHYIVNGSGVLINERVVLTAAHVRFIVTSAVLRGRHDQKGYVSFQPNFNEKAGRFAFDWAKDFVSHPSTAKPETKNQEDTTRLDVALVFLAEPAKGVAPMRLPAPGKLKQLAPGGKLRGVGFGLNQPYQSKIAPGQRPKFEDLFPLPNDGLRRTWNMRLRSLVNDVWLQTECGPGAGDKAGLGQVGMGDSGGPCLFEVDGKEILGGLACHTGNTPETEADEYFLRADDAEVQTWIRDTIKERLGVALD